MPERIRIAEGTTAELAEHYEIKDETVTPDNGKAPRFFLYLYTCRTCGREYEVKDKLEKGGVNALLAHARKHDPHHQPGFRRR